MKLNEFIKTTLHERLTKHHIVENTFNDNFRKWFGNSKVVDKTGNPLVVYHGTNVDFTSFSKDKIGDRHWQSKSDAHGGGFFFTDKENKASMLGVVKKVYLKMDNPLIRTLEDNYGGEVDYYHATDMFDNNPNVFFQEAKEKGNDGIIIKTPRGSLYVVLNPNQIKSIENDGTWDIGDDNINS